MRNWILVLDTFIVGLSLSAVGLANPPLKSESVQISREIFADLLAKETLGQAPSAAQDEKFAQWLTSYRQDATTAPTESLANGPYVDLLLASQINQIYPAAYASSYASQYQNIVVNTPLDLIFDALIGEIVDGSALQNKQTAAIAQTMGVCLAKKVQRGKSDSCKLDLDEKNTRAPGFLQLAVAKLTCFAPVPSACWARQAIFQDAKAQLIAAVADPSTQAQVAAQFYAQFPKQFEAGFFTMIDGIRADLGSFFGKKTASSSSPLWSATTPLLEQDNRSTHAMTMKQFASSVDADVMAAEHFSKSGAADLKAYAPPLLYAAAGKLLTLTGGMKAEFDLKNKLYALGTDMQVVPPAPLGQAPSIPVFTAQAFGGLGMTFPGAAGAAGQFADWDWANYDPKKAWEIFPSQFAVDAQGVPSLIPNATVSENIEDLASLLEASVNFFKLTAPGAPLGQYFSDNIALITDTTSPVIFPTTGRSLAIGVIGAVLQNVIDSVHGHLSVVDQSATGGAVQITYYDQVGGAGRVGNPVPVKSVAQLLEAAVDVNSGLSSTDPLVPASLSSQLPQLSDAIQIGTFSMLSHGQAVDGGFMEFLDSPQTPRSIQSQIAGLSLLLRYYDVSGIRLLKLNIETAFQFLDHYFPAGSNIPMGIENTPTSVVSNEDLWALLRVWDLMQNTLSLSDATHAGVTWNFDYPTWSARFGALSAQLNRQPAQAPD